jgi:hypothetical protein
VARRLAPTVRIADGVDGFVAAIDAALAEPAEAVAERAALAARHSWAIRTRAKLDHVESALARPARRPREASQALAGAAGSA